MGIDIIARGFGLAAILGAGAILLAAFGNSDWFIFLIVAIIIWILSRLIR